MKKADDDSSAAAADNSTPSSSADHRHAQEHGLPPSTMSSITDSSSSSPTTTTTTAREKKTPALCQEDVDVLKIKARQFVERVIRLQLETCYGGTGQGGTGIGGGANKDAFLHFVRILQRHLQQKDPVTHVKVKAALQECAQRRKLVDQTDQADQVASAAHVAGYETVAASMASTLICLQQIVRPVHWKRVVDYMKQQSANNSNFSNSNDTFVWSLIESIAMDDMIFFTQRLLEKQQEFKAKAAAASAVAKREKDDDDDDYSRNCFHHPMYVDIGVHYTKYANLDRIQVNGLLSRNERGKIGILAERFNGDVHGNGIYTGNNPYAYSDFGDAGILVARLKGNVSFRTSSSSKKTGGEAAAAVTTTLKPKSSSSAATTVGDDPHHQDNYDSIIVGNGYSQIVVLGESSQCIPLLHYPRSIVDKHKAVHHHAPHNANNNTNNEFSSSSSSTAAAAGSCAILYYQEELQKIVDEFFNQGIITAPRRTTSKPPVSPQQQQTVAPPSMTSSSSTTTPAMAASIIVKNVIYQIVYMIAFMAIVGTIISMSVSLCLFLVKTMSSLSSSRFIEL